MKSTATSLLKNTALFVLGVLLFLFSCNKADPPLPADDLRLQKFWKFADYLDKKDNRVHLPGFNPDTLPFYEVNIMFLWNELSERYEIQGQGPYDIFWGEYRLKGSGLVMDAFETTGLVSAHPSVADHEKLFFSFLRRAISYSVLDNQLVLTLDNGVRMVFKEKEEQYLDQQPYLSASINGMEWEADAEYTSCFVRYNNHTKSYNLSLGGISNQVLADGMRYDISFSINLPPARGVFGFNNQGAVIDAEGGVMGSCYGRFQDQYHVDSRSTNGHISVRLINRSFVEGSFYFDAEGDHNNSRITNLIREGKFLIRINGDTDWFKPYKF